MPLEIEVKAQHKELFNNKTEKFITLDFDGATLVLEHSLISISKWESKWKKAFISNVQHTSEELLDYIRCMTISLNCVNKDQKDMVYDFLTSDNLRAIKDYIEDPHTATTITSNSFAKRKQTTKRGGEKITSEVIYSMMIEQEIPPEYAKWHLNNLMMLIRVHSIRNSDGNKMNKKDSIASMKALNAARRKRLGSKG